MTTKQLEKSIQEIWELFRETDRRIEKTDRRLAEQIAAVNKAIGDLGGKWGQFVEGLVLPAVKRLFRERGIMIEQVFLRAESSRNGDRMEVDILAANGDYVVVVEAKSTLSIDDVNEQIERLQKFKTFFPQYKDHRLIGAVAGIVIPEGVDRYAYKAGLFIIGQSGDTVNILNDELFTPREW